MDTERLFDIFFTLVLCPAVIIFVKNWFSRKAQVEQAVEVHLQNAKVLSELVEAIAIMSSGQRETHFGVMELLNVVHKDEKATELKKQIKDIMEGK